MIIDKDPQIDHPHYGEVIYDDKGYPICHICGLSFKKILSHSRQKHGISALEYKIMFGLDRHKGIVSEETREKLRESVKRNYDVVVANNLIKGGSKSRFKSGDKGRTKDKLSEQTRRMLVKQIAKTKKEDG